MEVQYLTVVCTSSTFTDLAADPETKMNFQMGRLTDLRDSCVFSSAEVFFVPSEGYGKGTRAFEAQETHLQANKST